MNNNNKTDNHIERSNKLIEKICEFLQCLKKKEEPLEAMIEKAKILQNESIDFVEKLGDDKEDWYFWKFINDSQAEFYDMELHYIFDCLIEDGEWPHPE